MRLAIDLARAFVSLTLWAGMAQGACRQSLVLALDVSGSVDEREYVLQLEGVARALEDPAVRAALLDMPATPVALAIFEWSGGSYQRLIQDWISLGSANDIALVTTRLRVWQRSAAPETTALGAAMEFAVALQDRGPRCWRRVLDISGDGKNNDWPRPRTVRASGQLGDMTINALVIKRAPPSIERRFPRRSVNRDEPIVAMTSTAPTATMARPISAVSSP